MYPQRLATSGNPHVLLHPGLYYAVLSSHLYAGFYDLYKNVPVVRQAMSALSARLFPSAQQLFEWLERHAQVRYAGQVSS
jgi:hypothetical protein